ncbi:MAG: hypothetical protein Q9187_001858, partial [Circinaria calcarea]
MAKRARDPQLRSSKSWRWNRHQEVRFLYDTLKVLTDSSEPDSDGRAAKQAGEIDALARRPLIERSSNINEAARKRKSRKRTAPAKVTEAALPPLPGPKFARHPACIDAEVAAYTSSLTALVGPIEDFQQWTDERAKGLKLRKVGEGSYGEV